MSRNGANPSHAAHGKRRIVVGVSGASGAPYAKRLLDLLGHEAQRGALECALAISRTADEVWQHECGGSLHDLPFPAYDGRNYNAPFASGSAGFDAMVVIPASMSCIARIAHGISDDVLTRAADVMLKERRRLIIVPRETPFSTIHLQNLLALAQAGATVLPASPSFYGRPETLADAIDTVVARVLDHLGIANDLQRRWGRDVQLASAERHRTV